ncbi:MAG: hypothetical protein DSZ28_07050 [Thiothrix sp.]|nr:MAG: hypothetical protein DSZ28_07050 [Thiothrix sp.]
MKKYRVYLAVCVTAFVFTCSAQAEFLSNGIQPGEEGGQQPVEDEQGQASEATQPPLVDEAAPSISTGELPEAAEGPLSSSSEEQVASAESNSNAAGWLVEDQEFFPEDAPIGQLFGNAMAVSGNTLVVGGDGGGNPGGVAYVYQRNESGSWGLEAKLAPENPTTAEYSTFGRNVAIDGDTVAVAVSEKVYVYARTAEGWVLQANIETNGGNPSVAIGGDTLMVGNLSANSVSFDGSIVQVFTRDAAGAWTFKQSIFGRDERPSSFGKSISIDGDMAIVGDPVVTAREVNSGLLTILRKSNSGFWSKGLKMALLESVARDRGLGESVAISGNRIVAATQLGTAWVLEWRDDGSENGTTDNYPLVPTDGGDGSFGASVAINGDTIVIGADKKSGSRIRSGAAYVFKPDSNGAWKQTAMLRDHSGGGEQQKPLGERGSYTGHYFGSSAAVSDDGNVLVGAKGGDDISVAEPKFSGFAYSFYLTCQSSMDLPRNQWSMISLPCQPPVNANAVGSIFGNFGLGEYGREWAVYRYDPAASYVKLSLDSPMSQGRGYWMIQNGSNESVQLSMPAGSTPTPVDVASYLNHDYDISRRCDSERGCFSLSLLNSGSDSQWNLMGHPFRTATPLDRIHVVTDSATSPSDCSGTDGCTLAQAEIDNILKSVFWVYNEGQYQSLGSGNSLNPWDGFFTAPLAGANGSNAKLLVSRE